MKNVFYTGIIAGLLMYSSFSQAENEASYNTSTGILEIPKVLIGSDYYTVNMKYKGEALDFEVTNYEKIEPKAHIETIDIQILESFPVQVNVVAKGFFSNGCQSIANIYSDKVADIFNITITTKSVGEVCTAALVPFEEIVPLEVNGLKAGSYHVDVNGVTGTFTLDIDN
ncbi:hypothetical protein [Methyloprofundus sp.]|uniref:hypothetical protein n=1 Tax=Methyloprofundus sp. TaxID=2020875 RepID=UPI003D14ADE6